MSPSGALAAGAGRRPRASRRRRAARSCSRRRWSRAPSRSSASRGSATSDVPDRAPMQAVVPEPLAGGITGVVWRDFKPGGGAPGVVEQEELGLPGSHGRAPRRERSDGPRDRRREPNGTFAFEDVQAGTYQAAIGRGDVLRAVRGRLLARRGPDHARDHDGLHLGLGRLLDGRDRRRPRRHPARPARGGAHGRRDRVAGLPAGDRPVARAGADGRLHHDADLRPQGVRHRDRRSRPGRSRTTRT